MTDAEVTFAAVLRSVGENGIGLYNWGRVKNDKFDQLAIASSQETDPAKRQLLVNAAVREYIAQTHLIPLHRQVIPWAARTNIDAPMRADNWLEVPWVSLR